MQPSTAGLNHHPQQYCLRTSHCLLNKHLKRIGLNTTGLCHQCQVLEDVDHFLFSCSKSIVPRTKHKMNLIKLDLGMDFNYLEVHVSGETTPSILSDKAEKFVTQFINSTCMILQVVFSLSILFFCWVKSIYFIDYLKYYMKGGNHHTK